MTEPMNQSAPDRGWCSFPLCPAAPGTHPRSAGCSDTPVPDLWRRGTHIPGVYVAIDADRNIILRTPHGDIPVAKPLELASDLDTAAGMSYIFGGTD